MSRNNLHCHHSHVVREPSACRSACRRLSVVHGMGVHRAELILRTTHYCSLRTIPAFLYPWVGIHMEHRLFPLMLASSIFLIFCHQCSSYVSSRAWAIQADEDLIMVHLPTHLLSGEVELVHGSQFHPLGEWPSFRSTTEGGYGCASSGDGCLPRIRNV